jgi:DNA invertase Pin-like site-specific DNA recombinase
MAQAAAIYCRISADTDGAALGVKRQEKDCRALAERKGWTVGRIYVDNDIGAWSGKHRPEYRRMLDDVKAGTVDAVIVYHLDRLTRRPIELEEFFEICDTASLRSLACVTGDIDLATHDGQFMARILGAVARKESDDKSRRTRRKHLELAESGAAVGSGRPFGYENDRLTIHPGEAALVREAARRILAGDTLRSICVDWSARGIRAVKGGEFTPTSLRRVLTEPRWAGLRSHGRGGNVVAKAQWPAIIDEPTHQRLRAILLDPSRATNVNFRVRSYLLTGFLYCGRCGTRMVARATEPRYKNSTSHRRSYVCSSGPNHHGCGGIRIKADPLEDRVSAMVLEAIDTPELHRELAETIDTSSEDEIVARIEGAEGKLRELAEMWAAQEISRAEWLAARSAVENRLSAARTDLARLTSQQSVAALVEPRQGLRDRWSELSLERRRTVIAAVVNRITIGPAQRGRNTFDWDRVEITWRV